MEAPQGTTCARAGALQKALRTPAMRGPCVNATPRPSSQARGPASRAAQRSLWYLSSPSRWARSCMWMSSRAPWGPGTSGRASCQSEPGLWEPSSDRFRRVEAQPRRLLLAEWHLLREGEPPQHPSASGLGILKGEIDMKRAKYAWLAPVFLALAALAPASRRWLPPQREGIWSSSWGQVRRSPT